MKCPNCQAGVNAAETKFVDCSYCGTRFLNEALFSDDADTDMSDMSDVMKAVFKDRDNDGIPDVFQAGDGPTVTHSVVHSSITVNGKSYDSMDAVPAEIREILGALGPVPTRTAPKTAGTTARVFDDEPERASTAIDISDTFLPELPKSGTGRSMLFFIAGLAVAGLVVYLLMR